MSRPAFHCYRPFPQCPLYHLLGHIVQRRLLTRQQRDPFNRRAPRHIALILHEQFHQTRSTQPLLSCMRCLRHYQAQMPSRSGLLQRHLSQQPGKFIGVPFKRSSIPLHNSPSHIGSSLAYLCIVAE